jgi:hypothetical protein
MVSGFVTEEVGWIELSDAQFAARKARDTLSTLPQSGLAYLEIGKNNDGYWTNDKFLVHVDINIRIAEILFPDCDLVLALDHSGNHRKLREDALDASRMSVSDNTKSQHNIRSTYFMKDGQRVEQEIGKKGLTTVLTERGMLQPGKRYTKAELQKLLAEQPDFAEANDRIPIVESFVAERGHKVIWLPRYHCELNFIELCWNRAKKFARRHCNFTLAGLREVVPRALHAVSLAEMRRFARLCRDYLRAYADGAKTGQLKDTRKIYKSHRRVFASKLQELLGVDASQAQSQALEMMTEDD